APPGFTPFRSK
nr:RecName: Full=[Ala1,Thr6]-bradykinyl-Ser,Lys [Physalaemus signifer]